MLRYNNIEVVTLNRNDNEFYTASSKYISNILGH